LLAYDEECSPEVVAMLGASAALCISRAPFDGPVVGAQVGYVDGQYVLNPNAEQIKKGAITSTEYPKKKLDEIIIARLSDIFELIENHLKKIGKNGLLPAGIIMTGGGSGITTIEDLARAALKLPSKLATPRFGENTKIKDASWAVAYGLCIWGLTADEDESPVGIGLAQKTGGNFLQWVKQFLP